MTETPLLSEKDQRLNQLIALCVRNNLTPNKTPFCDFIIRACASIYGYEKRTAKSYVDILISAYRFNRWQNYVQFNPHLTDGEKQAWINLHL
jgi:hypothetical protein